MVYKIVLFFTRIARALLKRVLGFFASLSWTLKWNLATAESAVFDESIAHLLIVKNNDYVRVARICVSSFLHFNPKSRIYIHCDQATYAKTKSMVRNLTRKKQVHVQLDQSDYDEWQLSKLKLILKLSGSRDFYMDADLKWNGPLPQFSSTAFFVREFTFSSKLEYEILLNEMNLGDQGVNTMKNTSFFCWNGNLASKDFTSQLFKIWNLMLETISHIPISENERTSLRRISEQLSLSILIPDGEASYIKDKDAQFDKAFVESSYYGATGTRFGWLGITSR